MNNTLHALAFICIALLALLYGKTKHDLDYAYRYIDCINVRVTEDEATMAGQGRLIQQSIRDLAKLGAYDKE